MPSRRKRPKSARSGAPSRARFLWLVAFLLTLLLAGEICAGAWMIRELRALARALSLEASVGAVSVEIPTLSARITDVRISRAGAPRAPLFLEIRRCDAALHWRAVFRRGIFLRRVSLSAPAIRFQEGSNRPGTGFSKGGIWIRRLEVAGGSMEWLRLAPDGTVRHTLVADRIQGTFEGVGVGNVPGVGAGGWAFTARLGETGGIVRSNGRFGRLAVPPSFEMERFDCEAVPLAAIGPWIEEVAGCLPFAGTLDCHARVSCVDGMLEAARVAIRLRSAVLEGRTAAGRELAAYVHSRGGELEESFEVSGTWDAPRVAASGFVTRLVLHKVGRGVFGIVTLPFRALGAIFRGGDGK